MTVQPNDELSKASASKEHFDSIAHQYDESIPAHVVEHYLQKRVNFIQRHTRPCRTLDVGCGTGQLAIRLADLGYKVTGLDSSAGMLQLLQQKRPDITTVVGSAAELPFANETFELTYCVAVMHHVAHPAAVRRTLLEMARVTAPGGLVLVWDHNPRNPYWPIIMRRVPQDSGAERLIPESEVVAGLQEGGARVRISRQLGLMPDFAPKLLTPVFVGVERLAERTPVIRRLCAHNVVLAIKEPDGNRSLPNSGRAAESGRAPQARGDARR